MSNPTEPTVEVAEPNVEVDLGDFQDSDYGSCPGSETMSLCSSINEYVEQNGRRYHMYFGPDKNPMPSDEVELERLDIMHECIILIGGGEKTHHAPADKMAHRVLDLGTGTGIWAVDYAQDHPHAEVRGIDLTPVQPTWVPPNCKFEIDDFEAEWTFKQPFDYINARMLAQSVNDWDELIGQAKASLRPGGFLELGEYHFTVKSDDNTVPDNWPPKVLFDLITKALKQLGRKSVRGDDMKQMLEKAGFEDIHVKAMKLPMGPWAKKPNLKQAGQLYMLLLENNGYEAYGLQLLTQVLGMSVEETKELLEVAKQAHFDKKNKGVHGYFEYYSVYGRLPEQ